MNRDRSWRRGLDEHKGIQCKVPGDEIFEGEVLGYRGAAERLREPYKW